MQIAASSIDLTGREDWNHSYTRSPKHQERVEFMRSKPHKKSIQKLHLKSLTRVIDMYNTPLGTSLEAKCLLPQAMLLELEAIRGHRSAHSFATGPVTVEPAETRREHSSDVMNACTIFLWKH